MKNSVVGFNSISEQVEERISKLEDRSIKITKSGEKKEEGMEKSRSVGHGQAKEHIHQGSPKSEDREKGTERKFEIIMAPKFPIST